jgi:hypothetical protein
MSSDDLDTETTCTSDTCMHEENNHSTQTKQKSTNTLLTNIQKTIDFQCLLLTIIIIEAAVIFLVVLLLKLTNCW